MRLKRTRTVTLAVVLGLAGLYAVFALLAAAPVLAVEGAGIEILLFDDDHVPVLDGRGELIGYAKHRGGLRCDEGDCSQQTEVQFLSSSVALTVTYSFESLQAAYPDEEKVVVAGTGILTTSSQTAAFPVSVTFQNNGDGTIYTKYDAAYSGASFTLPRTSGSIEFNCYATQSDNGDFDELVCKTGS